MVRAGALGKYRLLHRLAAGGMGEIFLAQMAGPQGFVKNVVVKRIHPHLSDDQRFVEMFLNEARLAAQLNHPNIVQVFDFGEHEGIYYLAMEYIEGVSLRAVEREAHAVHRQMPIELSARIISRVCDGLSYAHELNDPRTGEPLRLVHRDVSSENILLSYHGAPKIIDFGTAKSASIDETTGSLKGKVSYMAPERLRRLPIDNRVDIFALGVVLYRLLTGTKPFEEESDAATMHAIVNDPHPPLLDRRPDAPPELALIVDRALAKDRDQRYRSCREMQVDLENVITLSGVQVHERDVGDFARRYTPQKARRVEGILKSAGMSPLDTNTPSESPREPPKPTFAATLEGSVEKLHVRLTARYGPHEIPVEPEAPDWAVVSEDGAAKTIPRSVIAESEAILAMERLGLKYKPILGRFSAFGETAIELWARAKEMFPEGWEVNIPTKARAVLLPPIRAKVAVGVLAGRFELEVSFLSGTEAVNDAAIREAIKASKRFVRVRDGHYTAIGPGVARAQQTLDALELSPGAWSLPLIEAVAVGDLIESSSDRRTTQEAETVLSVLCGQPANVFEPPTEHEGGLGQDERACLAWLEFLRRHSLGCILADERPAMRAKLILTHMLGAQSSSDKRHLLVAPSAALVDWEVSLYSLTSKPPLVFASFESFAHDHESLDREFDIVVFDRLHEIPEGDLAQTLRTISAVQRVAICPVPSRPSDLWRIFSIVLPGLLGDAGGFHERFNLPIERGDMKALERLAQRVRPFVRGASFVTPAK